MNVDETNEEANPLVDVKRTDTHETRYVGSLDTQQLSKVIDEAVRKAAGVSQFASGVSLTFSLREDGPGEPRVDFCLVQDHRYVGGREG